MKQAPIVLSTLIIATAQFPRVHGGAEVDENFNARIRGTVHAIALMPDASVYVGGEFDLVNATSQSNLARLNANGDVDNQFLPVVDGAVLSLAVGADGGLYAGGAFNLPARHVARISFTGAVEELTLGASTSSRVDCLSVSSGGAVAFGGPFRRFDGTTANYVGMLTAAGSRDEGFNSALTPSFALEAGSDAIAFQPDGRILVGGNFNTVGGAAYLVRLHSNGSLDASFSNDHGPMLYPKVIVLQADRRILVGGVASSDGKGFVRRLNPDGSVDAGFQAPIFDGSVEALALAEDGTMIVGGSFSGGLARLGTDGAKVSSWTISANGVVKAIAIGANDSVLVGGAFSSIGNVERSSLARLNLRNGQQAFATNANGRFSALLAGEAGKSYDIEASEDLLQWSRLGSAIATSAGVEIIDPESEAQSHRFFRARLLE